MKIHITITEDQKNQIEALREIGESLSSCTSRLIRKGAAQEVAEKLNYLNYMELKANEQP